MNASAQYAVETSGLSKAFHGVYALKSLDLKVPKHSIFGFLGPNGAGKSTTIKLLLGLSRPTSGSAQVFGMDIAKYSPEIRHRVGYLAQEPRYYEHMTARQILRFTARFFFSGTKAAIEDRVEAMLTLVRLEDKADRPIKGFSGGERQRLGIAQAQINDPELLILDEPAASLDPAGRHDVLEIMERLRSHATIFYSTHILSDVQRVSDTVAILKQGELVAQAPIQELLQSNGNMVYSVTFKGQPNGTREALMRQPWVTSVQATPNGAGQTWQIAVTDESAAAVQLLPLFAAHDLKVTNFGRKAHDLEDVFLNLTGDQSNG
jgi:ABC-2 type transport system ATP-binding protein